MRQRIRKISGEWRGFTLVEIMVVVAIIGALVAIAMPNYLRIRINTNEGVVREDVRAFSTSNESYRAFQNPPVYGPDIVTLISENYIDESWLNPGNKHGYVFAYARGAGGETYSIEAIPMTPGITGNNYYCIDQSGVLVIDAGAGLGTAGGCVGGSALGS